MDDHKKGLFNKYHIERTDGSPIHPSNEYFVLKLAGIGDTWHIAACREAVQAYANAIERKLPELAKELREKYPVNQTVWNIQEYKTAERKHDELEHTSNVAADTIEQAIDALADTFNEDSEEIRSKANWRIMPEEEQKGIDVFDFSETEPEEDEKVDDGTEYKDGYLYMGTLHEMCPRFGFSAEVLTSSRFNDY